MPHESTIDHQSEYREDEESPMANREMKYKVGQWIVWTAFNRSEIIIKKFFVQSLNTGQQVLVLTLNNDLHRPKRARNKLLCVMSLWSMNWKINKI